MVDRLVVVVVASEEDTCPVVAMRKKIDRYVPRSEWAVLLAQALPWAW